MFGRLTYGEELLVMPVASDFGCDLRVLLELLSDTAAILVPYVDKEFERVASVVKTACMALVVRELRESRERRA